MTYKDLRQYGFAPNECDYIIDLIQKEKADAIEELVIKCKEWNKTSSKRIPYKAIEEISKQLKEQLKEKLKE